MLPIVVTPDQLSLLHTQASLAKPMTIDLADCQITLDDHRQISFEVPDWRRQALLNGWDEIDLIENQDGPLIAEFEARQKLAMPWLYGQ